MEVEHPPPPAAPPFYFANFSPSKHFTLFYDKENPPPPLPSFLPLPPQKKQREDNILGTESAALDFVVVSSWDGIVFCTGATTWCLGSARTGSDGIARR